MDDGWVTTTIGAVAAINPESVRDAQSDRIMRYIDLSAVSAERGIDPTAVAKMAMREAPGRARRVVRTDDVLVATVRPYLRGFAVVPKDLDGEVASTGFTVLRARSEEVLPGYLWATVTTDKFVDGLMARATGSNYPAVRPGDVAEQPIDVPPLAEQRRIVDLIGAVDVYAAKALNLASAAQETLRAMLREWTTPNSTSVPLTTVADVLDTMRVPVNETERATRPGSVPYYGATGRVGWIDEAIFEEPLVLLGEDGAGLANWAKKPIAYMIDGPAWVNNHAHVLRPKSVPQAWLYMSLCHYDISGLINSGTRPKLNKSALTFIQINVGDEVGPRSELLVEVESLVVAAQRLQEATALLRAGLLRRLISGDGYIPTTYDRFLDGAA